jgi:HD-GYP domain-containing protein (c-di-GMP phosphodiesterase class II)
MGGSAHPTPYLRFALISLIVVAAVTTGYAIVGSNLAAGQKTDAAAREAAHVIGEPYRALFDRVDTTRPVDDDVVASADAFTFMLGPGDIRGVRITNSAGEIVYEGGARFPALPPENDPGAVASTKVTGDDGAELFVTQLGGAGFSVDIAQDADALNSVVDGTRVTFIATAAAFAALAWLAMQGAFWIGVQPLSRGHGRLAHLLDTGERLRSSMDLHDVLSQLARDATRLGGAEYGLVALYDNATSEVMLRATYDRSTGSVALHQRAIDDWFIRRAIAGNSAHLGTMTEAGVQQYFGRDAAAGKETPLFVAPMAIGDRIVGAVAVVSPGTRSNFSPAEARLIEQLASQAVTAVEQSILFAKVRSDAKAIEDSYDSTLKALMAALDAKDRVTEGHCERVGRLTVELATRLGIPDAQLVHIERGAMLHDVGKIGVPDEILKKPDALSDHEWEAMRKHPLLAGLLVSKVGFLEPAMPILLYHHEKFDGTGYPFGLSGSNIPLEARIFTIVDAYDAMTQDRPYRDAMSHHDAMEEIRAHNGTQFDPEVVAAFEELMASKPDMRENSGRRVLNMQDVEHADHDEEVA